MLDQQKAQAISLLYKYELGDPVQEDAAQKVVIEGLLRIELYHSAVAGLEK